MTTIENSVADLTVDEVSFVSGSGFWNGLGFTASITSAYFVAKLTSRYAFITPFIDVGTQLFAKNLIKTPYIQLFHQLGRELIAGAAFTLTFCIMSSLLVYDKHIDKQRE